MPIWKVLFIVLLASACLTLAFASLIVPITIATGNDRWLWLAGLLAATAVMIALFSLFLRSASAGMLVGRGNRR
jgi:hypothetical protein